MDDETEINRIRKMTEAVRKAAEGDFSFHIDDSGQHDELDLLVDEIRRMAESVQEHAAGRKAAEDARRDCQEKYRRLKANIPGMVYIFALHPDGTFSFPYVSEASRQLFDVSPEELMADATLTSSLIHPDDRERFASSGQRAAETLQPWREVLRHIVNGEVRWYDCMSRPELQPNGDILWDGIILEITERMRAETEFRQSERRYRDIFESSPVGIFRSTLAGKFLNVNPALARILKYDSPEDLMETVNRKSIAEVLYPEPGQRREVVADILSHEGWQIFEERFRCKDGSIIICNFHYRAVPGQGDDPWEFEGFVVDITESTHAKDASQASEERYHHVLDTMLEGFQIIDYDWRYVYVNETAARQGHFSKEALTGHPMMEMYPGIDNTEMFRTLRKCMESRVPSRMENKFIYPNDDIAWFELSIQPSEEGIFILSTDVTERMRAEEALRESEEKFRVLAETAPAAIVLYQGERIVYVNSAATRLYGYSSEELLEMKFWEWVHPDHRQMVMNRGMARQRGEQVPTQYEHRFINKSGEEGWVIVSAGSIEYQGKPAGIATFVDITETKRAEERISAALAEKVVLLKEVHHRVKNNLQIICTLLDLQSESIRDEEALAAFRESQDRIKAMSLIHERLYESKELASIDFQRYIEALSSQLFDSYQVDAGRISLQVDAGGVSIGIDQAIPCGLIINELVSNALKHAFPDNRPGVISIGFQREEDGRVSLRVADNGVGLPAGMDFTKNGTLGLQLVNMLARQLAGQVSLESASGTAFTIGFLGSRPA